MAPGDGCFCAAGMIAFYTRSIVWHICVWAVSLPYTPPVGQLTLAQVILPLVDHESTADHRVHTLQRDLAVSDLELGHT